MTDKNTSQKEPEIIYLLQPPDDVLRKNYIHQIKQYIEAYSHSLIVVGEAL